MTCKKCGELLGNNARVCPACGARQKASGRTKLNPTHIDYDDCAHERSRKKRPDTRLADLSGLLILIGVLLLILCGPMLLGEMSLRWGSPRMLVLMGMILVATILIAIGSALYKRR